MNYTKSQEAHLLRRAEKYRTIDEIRRANTKQGKFERSYLHYDWHDDFEASHIDNVDNDSLSLAGRRDFSLRSPAEQAQFDLDLEYYETLLAKTDTWLLIVFRAVFYGFSYRDIGIKKDTWRRKIEQIEKILRHEA